MYVERMAHFILTAMTISICILRYCYCLHSCMYISIEFVRSSLDNFACVHYVLFSLSICVEPITHCMFFTLRPLNQICRLDIFGSRGFTIVLSRKRIIVHVVFEFSW